MRNLKIKSKLILSFGIVILLALLLGAFAAQRANLVGRYYREFIDTHFYIEASSQAATRYAEIIDFGIEIVYWIIAFGVLLVAAAVIIAVYIIRSITRPIDRLKKSSRVVAQGNFSVTMRTNDTDELGELSNAMADMTDAVKDIVQDLTKAYNEYMKIGNMNYQIDDSKYQNSFKEVVVLINTLLMQTTKDIMSMGDVLTHISDGDFSVSVEESDWPGEWAALPRTVNALTVNLKGVEYETSAMIESVAAKGDLNFKTDEAKYKGDWKKIMQGLNQIAAAVDAPLKVLDVAFKEMKEGNFDLSDIDKRIEASGFDANVENYKGIFKDIMASFNMTLEDVASYIIELEQVLAQMADGDFRNKIERHYAGQFDFIRRSVNNIAGTLHKTMSEISTAADQVLSGASQISTSANDLASGAQEQASSIEELNAAIEVLNQQTQQNADNALNANKLSSLSATNAQEGNSAMNQTVEAMTQIKESSSNISQIIKTIQDIAFQTNLLALNASVEAARAGEHGKGFAVVAEEVRTLAGRSHDAVNETTTLIQESINRVEFGSRIAETTSNSLDAIVVSAGEVSEVIDSISTASQEQATAIEQVSDGLVQISKVTQSNSAVSEETAAAAEELNSQADLLRQLVSFFKL